MKTLLLLLFIVYAVEGISPPRGNVETIKKSSLLVSYPKKNNKVLHKSIKLLNRRYEKTSLKNTATKKSLYDHEYTVFPNNLPKLAPIDVPSSPYFPVEHQDEPKRVKKVLPDFWNNARRKRSLDVAPSIPEKPVSNTKTAIKSNKDSKVITGNRTSNSSPDKRPRKPKRKRMGKGKKGDDSRRLIAAKDGIIEHFPYVVSIQKDGEHWCTGSIVNPRLVVTTANCVWKSSSMSRLKIRAGTRHVENGGQLVRISQVMKHPSWSIRKGPDYDVALLLTEKNIRFSHTCHAVDLPNRIMMPVFEDAWITSWGAVRRDGLYDKEGMTLQSYYAQVMDRDTCNNITMRFGVVVTENFFCLEQIGRRAPCTRDTGAPAVSDGVLWGMASWGIRKLCGTERFPAMFSYLGSNSNMDFISNATHLLMSEERLSPFLDRYVPRAHDDVTTTKPLRKDNS